jgi:hypothetical protein
MPIQAAPVPQTPASRKFQYEYCENQTDIGVLINQNNCASDLFAIYLESQEKFGQSVQNKDETESEDLSKELQLKNHLNYWEKINSHIVNSEFNDLLNKRDTRDEIETIISKLSQLNVRSLNLDITNESIFFNFLVGDYSVYYDYFFEGDFDEENEIVSLIYENKQCVASIKGNIIEANNRIFDFLTQ